ncbi:MAG: HEAT repeat domain-containing protein [bacterium]|nr:HEAT repeat domain-containing protein [bacterium]
MVLFGRMVKFGKGGFISMGFFGLFGKNIPSEKAIAKQMAYVREQYAKTEYRTMAMEKLLEWNTKESLKGLLSRFTVVVQSPHWDEEEKRWLVDQLAAKGDLAKEVLIEFLLTSNAVTHAIQTLSRISSKKELSDVLIHSLKSRSPEDHRTGQSKIELIMALQEYDMLNLDAEIIPYLDDHNDDVKCAALTVLAAHESNLANQRLLQMLSEDHHSARVLRQTATTVAQLKIPIDPNINLVPEVLEDFVVKNGVLTPGRKS